MATKAKKYPHVFTEGDQLPEILGELKGQDLSGYTIEFALVRGKNDVIHKSTATTGVVFVDATAGTFKVTWDTDDLQEGKNQVAQIRFIDTSSRAMTSKDFTIDVKAKR